MADETKGKTIDVTPTWRGVLPILLEAYANGTHEGRSSAISELNRMADIADAYIAKHGKDAKLP